jgi:hypothetical protein
VEQNWRSDDPLSSRCWPMPLLPKSGRGQPRLGRICRRGSARKCWNGHAISAICRSVLGTSRIGPKHRMQLTLMQTVRRILWAVSPSPPKHGSRSAVTDYAQR